MEPKSWYGKPKFVYKVYKDWGTEVYSCVSVAKYQDDVVDELVKRFKGDLMPIRIYCNGILIKKLNYLKTS